MALYLGNQQITDIIVPSWDFQKAFFEAGGHCGYSTATSFVGCIAYNATSNLTSMYQFFYYSSNLKEVGLFDTSNVTNMSGMFSSCTSLTEIHMKNMAVNFDIHWSTKMEREALLEVINNLATVTSTRTLTIGSTLKAKLTDDDIAIATAKGWTIA